MSRKSEVLGELEDKIAAVDAELRVALRQLSALRTFLALNDTQERVAPNHYINEYPPRHSGRDFIFDGHPPPSEKGRKRLGTKARR